MITFVFCTKLMIVSINERMVTKTETTLAKLSHSLLLVVLFSSIAAPIL